MMPGFVGRLAFADRNLFGLGQKLVAEVDLGQGSHQVGGGLAELGLRAFSAGGSMLRMQPPPIHGPAHCMRP